MEKQSRILCFPFLGRLLLVVWRMRCAYEVKGNNLHLYICFYTQLKGPWKEWSISLVALSCAGFILSYFTCVCTGSSRQISGRKECWWQWINSYVGKTSHSQFQKSYIDMQSLLPIKVIVRFLLSVLGRGECHMGLQEPLSLLCCPSVALWQSLGICSRRVHPSEGSK